MHTPNLTLFRSGGLLVLLAACGRDAERTGVKFAGVGLDPEEIGPAPAMYGGIIEYDWVDFAGADLPLGLMGLVSYDGVGPDMSDFKPPYVLINGLGFVMETDLPATDTLYGNFGTAPSKDGTCYTNYEPQAYLSSLADVGTEITFHEVDGDAGWAIGRRPLFYPPDVSDVFPYYMELETWRTEARVHRELADASLGLAGLTEVVSQPPNFPPGKLVEIGFPGGIPPQEASWGSIPVPMATSPAPNEFTLPSLPKGVMLSWKGPVYDSIGVEVEGPESGVNATCLQFMPHSEVPDEPADCSALEDVGRGDTISGQLYTGPWETEDGLTFRWSIPEEEDAQVDQVMTIAVRFLGPVDEDDEYKQEAVVEVDWTDTALANWADAQAPVARDNPLSGSIPPSAARPEYGRRAAQPCDEDYVWKFDDALLRADGRYIPSLSGEPSHRLAEVTCRVAVEDGEFTMTEHMLKDAMEYAHRQGSQGAIFYVAHTTTLDLDTPPVRDRYGNRRDIAPVRVVSNAAQIGRFVYGGGK